MEQCLISAAAGSHGLKELEKKQGAGGGGRGQAGKRHCVYWLCLCV